MKRSMIIQMLAICILVLGLCLTGTVLTDKAVTALAEGSPISNRHTVVVDAGHGGEDGGAVSCTGIYESQLNLEVSLCLRDLLHLLGLRTVMIRTDDMSVSREGQTIASRKISDLKERVRLTNEAENAVLVSIHQNFFPDSQYAGAQVFYAADSDSILLAQLVQSEFKNTLNPDSRRKCKKAEGIYLMEHIQCPGVLIECGFLSNPAEEAKLRSSNYQKKLCCVIVSSLSRYLDA